MADIARLNGVIGALQSGKPAFTSFAKPILNRVVGHPHVDGNNVDRILGEGYRFLMAAPAQLCRAGEGTEAGRKIDDGSQMTEGR
jgi:hypothetical protein